MSRKVLITTMLLALSGCAIYQDENPIITVITLDADGKPFPINSVYWTDMTNGYTPDMPGGALECESHVCQEWVMDDEWFGKIRFKGYKSLPSNDPLCSKFLEGSTTVRIKPGKSKRIKLKVDERGADCS